MSDLGNKVKYFFGLETDDETNEKELPYEEVEEKREIESVPRTKNSSTYRSNDYKRSSYSRSTATSDIKASKIVPKVTEKSDQRMIICKYAPIAYGESTDIIDDIRKGNPVIINFEATEDYVAAKIVNICEGAAYALDADLTKIANAIFIIVPKGIDILNHISQNTQNSKDILG